MRELTLRRPRPERQTSDGAWTGPTQETQPWHLQPPRSPTERHDLLAESGLADLGRVGFGDAGRTVEVLVAPTQATLAIAARLATNTDGVRTLASDA